MKRIFSFLFAIIALMGTTGVFTSCQEDAPEINYTINITVNNDFTEVVNAINNGIMKQEAAIAALTAAIEKMNGDQTAKLQALIEAINTMATTLDAKLAIIEAAMKAQTLSLENKLDLLTAAVDAQTLKQEEMAGKLTTAIDNLSGSLEDKLDAIKSIIESTSATLAEKLATIEAAMKAQTLSLEQKLALIEAAIKALPDYTDEINALKDAIVDGFSSLKATIESTSATLAEKLEAVETAMKAQTLSLEQKFDLLVLAVNNQTLKQEEMAGKLTTAIDNLSGTIEDKLDAIEAIIESTSATLAEKLATIEAAMKAQTLSLENKLDLLTAAVDAQTLKQEEMGKLLATAIDNLSGTIEDKLDAIEAIIESTSATLAEKLATIEAAMKAQTLALETKLGLIEAAIKALPDYTDQLKAIEAAIKGMPDYSDKLAAIETALEAIAENIKAQEGQYADELEDLTESIDAITKAVEDGNKSQKDALAEIIALLESGALAGGGSGSGGEGGEGEGGEDEWTYQSITLTTSKAIGETIAMTVQGELAASEVEGAVIIDSKTYGDGLTAYTFELTSQTVTIKQASIAYILCSSNQITSVDLNNSPDLKSLSCYMNAIKGENMTNLVKSLPDRTGKTAGKIIVYASNDSREKNVITKADVAIAKAKNWKVLDWYNNEYEGLTYQSITITTSKAIGETITMTVDGELAASEVEGAVIKDSETHTNGNTAYTFELKNQTVTIKQASIEYILCTSSQITSMDFNNSPDLQLLYCYRNAIKGENMTNLVKSLPDRTGKTAGKIIVYAKSDSKEQNVITKGDVAIAKAKNWIVLDWYNNEYEGIELQYITLTTKKAVGEEFQFSIEIDGLGALSADERMAILQAAVVDMNITDVAGHSDFYDVKGTLKKSNLKIEIAGSIGRFTCDEMGLTSLDVSHCPDLYNIYCPGNDLTSLDVSNATELQLLRCNNNSIETLDVSKNLNLEKLYCRYNKLTSLDVSKNTKLDKVDCYSNQLESLLICSSVADGYLDLSCFKNKLDEAAMTALIEALPTAQQSDAKVWLYDNSDSNEGNELTDAHIAAAKAKGYTVKIKESDASGWETK